MCEQFFFPYNRKLWRRPLSSLAWLAAAAYGGVGLALGRVQPAAVAAALGTTSAMSVAAIHMLSVLEPPRGGAD